MRILLVPCLRIMRLQILFYIIAAALAGSTSFAQDQTKLTLDELVAKNIEAKGGADALRALQSLRSNGKMIVNEGQLQLAYAQTKKRPGEIRTEFTLQGMTAVQAYDGKEGWKISPFQGRKDPEKMSADDVKPLMEDAEIDGPLVDWKPKKNPFKYLGLQDVHGTSPSKTKVIH